MKRLFLLIALCSLMITTNAKIEIKKIDPTNWFVGMKDASLQLMAYGANIRNAEVTTNYPNVRIDSLVRLDSPNYLLIYLNLKDAQAGTMNIDFKIGKQTTTVKYALLNREMSGDERKGFDNSDVLYMLMPDRFANGNPKNDIVKGMQDQLCNRNEPSLRHGGDIAGIMQHLDYFTDLGVTALWFTPVLENDRPADGGKSSTYHGYATTDYYRVDPRFGTNADYKALTDACHKRGLSTIVATIIYGTKMFLQKIGSTVLTMHYKLRTNLHQYLTHTLAKLIKPKL